MSVTIYDSPIGRLLLEADKDGLCAVRLLQECEELKEDGGASPLLKEAKAQLSAYFAGRRMTFDLPLSIRGTAFEQAVWAQIAEIPFGKTRSYGQIAAKIGKPSGARAVGAACGRNPLLIVVPCHRVVSAAGRLTGFAAGLEAKQALLALEGHRIRGERLVRNSMD